MKLYYLGHKVDAITTGGEKYIKEVMDYLSERFTIDYIYPNKLGLSNGIKYSLKFKSVYAALRSNLWALRQSCKLRSGEIIITNSYFRHIFLLFIIIAGRVKHCTIITFVNAIYYYSRGNNLLNLIDKLLLFLYLSSSSLIISNSRSTKEELINLGIDGQKIKILYPRLDLPSETTIVRSNESKGRVDILFVGYCDPFKELHVLIKAIGLCKHSPLMLHIVGNNTVHMKYTEKIRSLIRQFDIEDKVKFYGRLEGEDLVKMYTLSDIFVSPGRGEGYGRVLIEAMYYGLPVIGANGGASRELIEDGINGFLFKPGDFRDLKDKITFLCMNEKLRKSMGTEGKKRSGLANFFENIGKQFCHIIKFEGLIPCE